MKTATFTALSTPVVAGTQPAPPPSTPQRVRVEYRNPLAAATAASFTLKATPTGGTAQPIPDSAWSTRYGLPTWTTTDDAGGLPGGSETTATRYDGSGLDPSYGLATDSIVDPATPAKPGALALNTRTGFEAPGATGYLRPTSSTLPSGDPANPATRTTTSYYGNTEVATNPCPGGGSANQGSLAQFTTEPAPATGTRIQTQSIHDAAGRPVATRNTADAAWTCTSYDARGRATQTSIPGYGSASARTVTTAYAVGGDPLTVSVTDPAGTITTRQDLLGRTVSYTDTTGTQTTTSYDLPGRVTSQTTTATGGGSSTLAFTYLADGRTDTVKLDAVTLATVGYDTAAEITAVSYSNGVALGGLTKRPDGQPTGQTFTLPGSHTLTDALTRSQSGRITRAQAGSDGATTSDWTYTYDAATRLTAATLAATGAHPQAALTYSFAGSGGCGADPQAGKNGSRTTWSSQTGTNPAATTTACTDGASRLTSTTGPDPITAGQAVYDGHGNATQLGNQAFTYDGADRVTSTTATTIPGTQTLSYTRDSTDRVVARTATTTLAGGKEAGTTRYAFTDAADAPDFQLTPTTALGERYLSLPGGVLYTKKYAGTGTDTWALPNLHGDITATCTNTGVATLSGTVYDPYGQPISTTSGAVDPTATPTTRTGTGTTDAWHGKAQRGYEHTGGLNQILMGARTYLPTLGIFTATDPIPGGNTTTYTYPQDPINQADLDGRIMKDDGGGRRAATTAWCGRCSTLWRGTKRVTSWAVSTAHHHYQHATISYNLCAYVCIGASHQGGVFSVNWGQVGLGVGVSGGWNQARASSNGRSYYYGYGGSVGLGGSYSWSTDARHNRQLGRMHAWEVASGLSFAVGPGYSQSFRILALRQLSDDSRGEDDS